ncbi:MAG TPA: hypothetical protein VKY24_12620, partial [Reyranella sp.]|nr:hypothetical protein [Reyranella sp.]
TRNSPYGPWPPDAAGGHGRRGATRGSATTMPNITRYDRFAELDAHNSMPRRTPITGNGREEKPLFAGLDSSTIAHRELTSSAGFVTFDVLARNFPRNRSAAHRKLSIDQKEKSVPNFGR